MANKGRDDKRVKIALRWMRGELKLQEAADLLEAGARQNVLPRFATLLRQAYRDGLLIDGK